MPQLPWLESAGRLQLLGGLPLWSQVLIVMVVIDFIEYFVHRTLHRVPFLWRFHKLHHSIQALDWIGNWRFHWLESLAYGAIKWLPFLLLGASPKALLIHSVILTVYGNLNHANLYLTWGPLRFLFNSPAMHVWHHDRKPHLPYGQNFAVIFSAWDWLFGTAVWPDSPEQPDQLGFHDQDQFPASLSSRLLFP